jgi:hypothetical protein
VDAGDRLPIRERADGWPVRIAHLIPVVAIERTK